MIVTNSVSGGGAEISMMRLFKTLLSLGVNVSVCAINEDKSTTKIQADVTVIGRQWGTGLTKTFRSLLLFRQHLQANHPDVLIVNCELPELYVSFTAPKKSQIFVVEHTSRPWYGRRPLGYFVRKLLYLRRSIWVTVSKDQSRIWPNNNRAIHIPNTHRKTDFIQNFHSAELVFIGRLNREKHPEIAAEVALMTSSTIDFFGDGPELTSLKQAYSSKQIHFHGFVENAWEHVSQNSILIVASEYEGDGMNVVEAISNGNPVLLKDNSDLRRFKLPEANYFSNSTELKDKVIEAKAYGVDKFRVSEEIVSEILSDREPRKVATSWIKLIDESSLR
jgi:glycosyltransferase involved in cell wall biosynthesis